MYLSISRPDLARKEFERAKRWAEDDLLLQLIEASIGLVTGKDGYADAHAFYTEQLANPSLSSPHVLAARGVARLLRGEVQGAKSDLEEAQAQAGAGALVPELVRGGARRARAARGAREPEPGLGAGAARVQVLLLDGAARHHKRTGGMSKKYASALQWHDTV